jgi:CBS domain-containing protein
MWDRLRSAGTNDSFRGRRPTSKEAVMFVSDVLRIKGHHVVRVYPTDRVESAVRKLAEHRIGAVIVEDRWMKSIGIFSERDFIKATAREGAAVLDYEVRQLMTSPVISCRSSQRVDAALATMTLARIRHLPVIDNGELKGIVSIGDLVKHRLDEKELEASVLLDLSRLHA